MQDFALKSWV
jgi:hypothetical protein